MFSLVFQMVGNLAVLISLINEFLFMLKELAFFPLNLKFLFGFNRVTGVSIRYDVC